METILASASPRRAALFRSAGIPFKVDPSGIDEVHDDSLPPGKLVEDLSRQKGEDVAKRHSDALLVASDTIVWHNNRALGKPANESEAREMLLELSSNRHTVYSGVWVCLLSPEGHALHTFSFHSRTKVQFSPLGEEEIEYYIGTGSPMDKAGSYGIQDDFGSLFVESIEGDYNTVVGFPLQSFYRHLKKELPSIHKMMFFRDRS